MAGKTSDERIGVAEEAVATLKDSDERQWEAIAKLQNRLPNWAVFLIAALSASLGWSLHYASTIGKIVGGS